jgi:DNA mismatch repair ATPase MutL
MPYINTPYITVHLVVSLPKIPYIHRTPYIYDSSQPCLSNFTNALQQPQAAATAGAEADDAAAQELERSFDKADFRALHVIGQFNLGFILARCVRCLVAMCAVVDQAHTDCV